MKITLINSTNVFACDGSHLISALLKRAGHSVRNVLLSRHRRLPYRPDEIEQLHEIVKETDLVMIAVYSSYADRAIQVTEFIRKKYPGMKVIWGGPHCISAPELSLRYADGVCFAEGDKAIVDFVGKLETGTDYLNTPNMAFNVNGSYKINNVLPPFSDLDSLPYYDYDLHDRFLLDEELLHVTKERFKGHYVHYPFGSPTFILTTSRGCPYECSYCNNIRYIAMHGHTPIRFQSVNRFIGELEYAIRYFDFFQFVAFGDDDFLLRDKKQLEEFAELYKKKIGRPFAICVSANTFRREKMEILLDAGLKLIQLGVQSGSQRILDEVFGRKIKVSKTKETVREIEPYYKTHGLNLLLDFIIDNPYEKGNDIIQTYQYLVNLPLHVIINIFCLAFFPGTPIYNKALKDSIIEPYNEKTFKFFGMVDKITYQRNYETILILLFQCLRRHPRLWRYTPRFVLRAMGSRLIRGIASIFPQSFYKMLIKNI
ncbi:MAG: B12-binding domain-containing radical SAM protein [Planctomycetia bacterium]|nr:B12-binding domain-containing radical SAM protein [Planctomycetia bacterium]